MKTTISSEFRIRGQNFNPIELSKLLKISHSLIWNKGDAIERSPIMRRKDSGWVLKIKEQPALSLEAQLIKLLKIISPRNRKIKEVCQQLNLKTEFSFAVYIQNNVAPSIYIEPEVIKHIEKLNAFVDIDIFCL